MTYTPITPFRRAVKAAHLKSYQPSETSLPAARVNKYDSLRELAAARAAYGLSNRDLGVLQALISFRPGADLCTDDANLVVHPSNAAICERLNGMPCSTMRRHLARLVEAGVIQRRDSPNGKRYVRRYRGEQQAFGFDLSPLVTRFAEFCTAAEQARDAAEALNHLRETVSLMRRDLAGLVTYGLETDPALPLWDQLSDLATLTARDLRRKLNYAHLQTIEARLHTALNAAREVFDLGPAKELSTNDAENEQHHQNSNKDSYDSEVASEKGKRHSDAESTETDGNCLEKMDKTHPLPSVPLGFVLSACPELRNYSPNGINHWHQLVNTADTLRPMMGISRRVWQAAKNAMGHEESAVVLVAMLERYHQIKTPNGYLSHLTKKAALGKFSSGPMIRALPQKKAA